MGNKLQSTNFLDTINGSEFIILTETWQSKCSNVDVTGYRAIIQNGVMSKNGCRNSGGIILLYYWIFFGSKSANMMPKQRKISTCVVFIFHQFPQIFLTPKFLKNSKGTYWIFHPKDQSSSWKTSTCEQENIQRVFVMRDITCIITNDCLTLHFVPGDGTAMATVKLRVFLAGHGVAMVTYCVTKITPTCSPVTGQFLIPSL